MHEPGQTRPAIVDDIVRVLVRRAGDVDAAARVLRDIEALQDALQAKIARLVFGEVPDDPRALDTPPRGTDVDPNI
jgi:hypothetical protein